MNRKFLDKRIVVSQFWRGMLAGVEFPDSQEGIIANQIANMTDAQKKEFIDKAVDNVSINLNEFDVALGIFKANGKSEKDFLDTRNNFEKLGIAHPYFHKLIVTLSPKMLDKRFSFVKFLDLLEQVCIRYTGNISRITKVFEDLLTLLPTIDQKMGSPDQIVNLIISFLLSGNNPEQFYNFVIQNTVTQWAYNMGKPVEVKPADAIKLQQALRSMRNPVTDVEASLRRYYYNKAHFDQFTYYASFRTAEILMLMRQMDMARIKTQFRNGVFLNDINFWMNLYRMGEFRNLNLDSTPFGPSGGAQGQAARPLQSRSQSENKKYIFAQNLPLTTPPTDVLDRPTPGEQSAYSTSGDAAIGAPPGVTSHIPAPARTLEDLSGTEAKQFQNLISKKQAEMDSFANQLEALSRFIDDRIKNIFSKSTAESPQIGPFQANTVFEYLLDTEKSMEEISQVKAKIKEYIGKAREDHKSLRPTIANGLTGFSGLADKYKKFALDWLDSKLIDFTRKLELKDLGLDFGKILLTEQNEFAQKQDTYENLKTEMESGRFIKPQIAPIALSVGFEMADILERISDKFKNLASRTSFQEQAMKTARKWQIFAKQQRNTVMKEIYPALADVIGIDATKPSVAPSFTLSPLSTSASSFNKNYRFAYELQSNKKVKDYWNSLFMESVNPVPMGDIIVEKPIHGNKSIGEEIKLHKKTMRRFKKKNRFKK